jgi:hypothetical protein
MTKNITSKDLFIGSYSGGIVYADRTREEHGDYKRLAFLPWHTLKLEIYIPANGDSKTYRERVQWVKLITDHARTIQEKAGQLYVVTACGQTVRLGGVK